jgi:hypothetical protein
MVAATALGIRHGGHLQWHDLPTEFRKSLPIGSKVDMGAGRHISLAYIFSFRKESRLKSKYEHSNGISYSSVCDSMEQACVKVAD